MQLSFQKEALSARKKVLELIYNAQTSHIGSNFSAIDILTVLFDKLDLDKDKFILSAGWKAASLYYFLWKKGVITEEELNSYCGKCHECKGLRHIGSQDPVVYAFNVGSSTAVGRPEGMFTCKTCKGTGQSKWIGLAEPIIPEIPFSGGSMGMGLPAAVGFALAKKLKGEEGKVYVLMSDGEQNIGTTYEAAMIAAHHKLDNLVVFVDGNGFQAMGRTSDILSPDLEPMWRGAGWLFIKANGGNSTDYLQSIFHNLDGILSKLKRPKVIFAHTTKGKGVSFMENQNIYHYKAPSREEYEKAIAELT